jgi:hypothetical protein
VPPDEGEGEGVSRTPSRAWGEGGDGGIERMPSGEGKGESESRTSSRTWGEGEDGGVGWARAARVPSGDGNGEGVSRMSSRAWGEGKDGGVEKGKGRDDEQRDVSKRRRNSKKTYLSSTL